MSGAAARPLRILSVSVEEVAPGTAARTHVLELAAALARCGAEVEVVAPPAEAGPPPRGLSRRVARILGTLRRAAARLHAADLLYLRAHPLLLPLARLARARGVPVVQEVNGRDVDIFVTHRWARPLSGMLIGMQRAQYRGAAAIAAVTPGLTEWARGLAGVTAPVGMVTNGVNLDIFRPGTPRPAEAPAGPYAVFFGNFHRWHGVGTILEAARHPAWPRGVAMLFVGDGTEAAAVDLAVADPASGGRVRRIGRRDQAQLAALVSHALASIVATENREGLARTGLAPLKLFESLGCGVPVVVTDQPGMADLVRRTGCGLVVPERDPGALAAAVAELAADPARTAELGRRAREEAVAAHGWDAKAAELLAFLTPILARRAAGARA